MKFEIHAKRDNEWATFVYDNQENTLINNKGELLGPPHKISNNKEPSKRFSTSSPLVKSKIVKKLKIQLGLSCNYSCSYCSQRFVKNFETNIKDVDSFLMELDNLEFSEKGGLKIEFWGGEPLVYFKTIKILTEKLQERFKDWSNPPKLSMITNGSLLTDEICAWLYSNDYDVAISHDGPGQSIRGPDPFDDLEKKAVILNFYNIMKLENRISFNAMLNKHNISRKSIHEWFIKITDDPNVVLGEGTLIDAYDKGGLENSLTTDEEHYQFRNVSYNDIYDNKGYIGFTGILQKINSFMYAVGNNISTDSLGQKCGMDSPTTLAVDLKGNVLTCQNVSANEIAPNGEKHYSGNISNIDKVEIKTVTHWKDRKHCKDCPVLQICQGSCMFLEGELWNKSCDNAYSNSIPLFALAFERMTDGYKPMFIKNSTLPVNRQNLWSNQND